MHNVRGCRSRVAISLRWRPDWPFAVIVALAWAVPSHADHGCDHHDLAATRSFSSPASMSRSSPASRPSPPGAACGRGLDTGCAPQPSAGHENDQTSRAAGCLTPGPARDEYPRSALLPNAEPDVSPRETYSFAAARRSVEVERFHAGTGGSRLRRPCWHRRISRWLEARLGGAAIPSI